MLFQGIIHSLLTFIKLKAEYHILCSNLITSALERLTAFSNDQQDEFLAEEMKSLGLLSAPPTNVSSKTKKQSQGAQSPKPGKHGLKASLFSLFERKSSPEEGKSAFYVDFDENTDKDHETVRTPIKLLDKNSTTLENKMSQSETSGTGNVAAVNQSEVLVDLGLDPPQDSSKLMPSGKGFG